MQMRKSIFLHVVIYTNFWSKLPSDSCWPTEDSWTRLNDTIGGRLIRGKPPASVCYPSEPNYSAAECSDVIKHWTSSAWHADNPVSISHPPSDGCYPIYPNGTSLSGDITAGERGCGSDTYPVYVVNASSASDVQAGVNFARQNQVRLNVKNTGHGSSSIPGSLSIWTHHFKAKEFHDQFHPQGSDNSTNGSMAISFGAGIMDREAFEFAAEHDAVVVGGTDGTVGLVGWGSAGGHGYLTGTYGLGADNFLEATVVTPDGGIIVANQYQNADVFWAISGGGGGTWGVITSVTVNAYRMPNTVFLSLTLSAQNGTTASDWYDVVAHVLAEYPHIRRSGLQGYVTLAGPPLQMTNALFAYNKTKDEVEETIEPLSAWLKSHNSTVSLASEISTFPKWIDVYHLFNLTQSVAGGDGEVTASRLLPAEALADTETLARTLEKIGPKETVSNVLKSCVSPLNNSLTQVRNQQVWAGKCQSRWPPR
jgi:hypothetical protein